MKSTSTWTSSGICLAAALGLAACADGVETGRALGFGAAPERVFVVDQAVAVAGPPGYCVDDRVSRADEGQAFVLLASCASISRDPRQPKPGVPGLLTVSVAQVGQPDQLALLIPRMDDFFRSQEGRAALSRSGEAQSVDILEIRQGKDSLYIHARDRAAGLSPAIRDEYWRALFDVNGRLVTASVTAFAARPIAEAASVAMLDALTARIRQETARLERAP